MTEVVYEPHPVSPERKAELIAQGKTILDAVYAPKGEAVEPTPTDITRESVGKMSRADIKEFLEAHGVSKPKGNLAKLKADLISIMFVEG